MNQKSLKSKLEKYLKPFLEENENIHEAILLMLSDLSNYSERYWDFPSMRYETVMTKKEWEEFSNHPDRQSYETKIKALDGKNFVTDYPVILQIIEVLIAYYKSLEASEFKSKLASGLSGLVRCVLSAKYQLEPMRSRDLLMGRSVEDRDNGNIEVLPAELARLEYAILERSRATGKNYETLRKQVMDLTGGWKERIPTILYTCRNSKELQDDLTAIIQTLGRDETLMFSQLQLGYKIWKELVSIGLDLDTFLEIGSFPSFGDIEKKFRTVLENKEYTNEILEHLKDELPESYFKLEKNGDLGYEDTFIEEATRKGYPENLRTDEEIKTMVENVYNNVLKYFPLAKQNVTRNIILNPLHPAAKTRASQSKTLNNKGEMVSVVVMTPLVQQEDEYQRVLAHEITHAVHRKVVFMGEDSGVLEKGSENRMPSSVAEYFAVSSEKQFAESENQLYKKQFEGKEFATFTGGISVRWQIPFSVVQLGIRRVFEKLIADGIEYLSERQMQLIKVEFDEIMQETWETNMPIYRRTYNSLGWFKPFAPDDGLVYLGRFLDDKSDTEKRQQNDEDPEDNSLTMNAAFEQRFGKGWMDNCDARIILHWIFLESGRNYKTDTYGQLVIDASVEECMKELEKIGIKKQDI